MSPKAVRQGRDPFCNSELRGGQREWLEGTASGLKQSWDCSKAEVDVEEGDVMDWLEDDDMMRQRRRS